MKKGDPFSATFPLNSDDIAFFSSFDDSSEELILDYEKMNDDVRSLSIATYLDDQNERLRLIGKLRKQWADQRGVEQQTEPSWWKIVGGESPAGTYESEPPAGWPQHPPAWDHATVWRGKSNKITSIAVSQPYPWLLNKDIDKLNQFATDYGFIFRITNLPSWHYPGRCWFIEWRWA